MQEFLLKIHAKVIALLFDNGEDGQKEDSVM
jgi:hypothetical protein